MWEFKRHKYKGAPAVPNCSITCEIRLPPEVLEIVFGELMCNLSNGKLEIDRSREMIMESIFLKFYRMQIENDLLRETLSKAMQESSLAKLGGKTRQNIAVSRRPVYVTDKGQQNGDTADTTPQTKAEQPADICHAATIALNRDVDDSAKESIEDRSYFPKGTSLASVELAAMANESQRRTERLQFGETEPEVEMDTPDIVGDTGVSPTSYVTSDAEHKQSDTISLPRASCGKVDPRNLSRLRNLNFTT